MSVIIQLYKFIYNCLVQHVARFFFLDDFHISREVTCSFIIKFKMKHLEKNICINYTESKMNKSFKHIAPEDVQKTRVGNIR